MLASVGRKSVLLGTIETRIGDVVKPSEHTTPESRDVLALFAEGVRAGCTEAVMEMSSHALEQERVWGLPVDVAIFTNLTQDHLDFHGDMRSYAHAKAKLFAGVGAGPPRVAVINNDAEYAGMMIDSYAGEEFVVRYGIGDSYGANHCAEELRLALGENEVSLRDSAWERGGSFSTERACERGEPAGGHVCGAGAWADAAAGGRGGGDAESRTGDGLRWCRDRARLSSRW